MNDRTRETSADWSRNTLWPTFQTPDHLAVYDIGNASQDMQLSVTTMTGVINRQQPKVYLLSNNDAAFWLNEVFAQVPYDVSHVAGNDVLDALLNSYGSSIRGLIIYDPNCIDSINVATMLAGQREGVGIIYRSIVGRNRTCLKALRQILLPDLIPGFQALYGRFWLRLVHSFTGLMRGISFPISRMDGYQNEG